jgi:hypothetical protein
MNLDIINDKLPWRIQTMLGYRPKSVNFKHITKVLTETKDNLPLNKVKLVSNGYDVKLKQPVSFLNDFRHHAFLENHVLPVEPVYFASIKNGRYCQYNLIPTILDSTNTIIDGAQRHPFYYNPWKNDYHYPLLSCKKILKPRKIKGKVLSIATDGGHDGYFHFIARIIPKLSVLEELNISLDEFTAIIINGPETKYKLSALSELGIPQEKVIFADDGMHIEAEYLFFVPRIRYHKMGLDYVREKFIDHNQQVSSNNIYLSRKDALHRKLIGEEALEQKLQSEAGFTSSQFTGKSLSDQANTIYNADKILSLHGAGLTNVIFAKEGSTLIEIMDEAFVNVNFWFYANLVNVDYVSVIGESIDTDYSISKKRPGYADIALSDDLQRKLIETVKS